MKRASWWRNVLARFWRSQAGNTLIMFALAAMAIMIAIAGAVDYSMFLNDRREAQDSLDEAALAVAISPSTDTTILQTRARTVFDRNFDGKKTNAAIKGFDFDTTSRAFTLTATGTYSTFMLGLIGLDRLPYTVVSKTVRAADGTLEVALVLDNTWSMSVPLDGSQTKLQVLKTAAQGLVTSVMTPANKPYVRIGVVPYAQYINVGTANRNQSWMSVPDDSTTTTTTPGTCTTISTKTTCSGGTQGTCTGSRDGVPYTYNCWVVPQTCTTVNITPYQSCTSTTTSTTTKKWYGCVYNLMSSGSLAMPDPSTAYKGFIETSSHCLTPIQPLTNDSAVIASSLNSLYVSTSSQETYIPGGLIWGVNVLSPPSPFSQGAAYDTDNKKPRKAIVLMTDGANTAYANGSGAVGVASNSQLATTYADELKVCNYARSKNIEVYTIGFGVTDAKALAHLKACATNANYYFDAKSSADLVAAFQTIGGQLTKVRIVR